MPFLLLKPSELNRKNSKYLLLRCQPRSDFWELPCAHLRDVAVRDPSDGVD